MKKLLPIQSFLNVIMPFLVFGLMLSSSTQHLMAQCQMMIDQDFDHWNNRRYTVADAKSDFNNKIKPWTASTYRGIAAPGAANSLIGDVKQETRIVDGHLRAEYTKNDAGGYAGGFLFDPYFDGVEEAYLEYKVKFDDNFYWATGGKLPGLGGSTTGINSETTGRGTIPSGCKYNTNGWSARLMWRRNRAQNNTPYLILYSYFAERENGSMRQNGDCGDGKRIFTGLQDDKWYTIRQYIKMNTPGQKNGVVVMWIDGVETYRDTKALIRNSGKGNLKINALIMNTYRGGSRTDPVWHSPRDEYAFFDDFKVWTGCSNPPDGTTNLAPTGNFDAQTPSSVEEGYDDLYVKVNASDPDGDDISLQLKIDGVVIRTEIQLDYEWGHQSNDPQTKVETLGLSVGDHLFEVVITDSKGASTTIQKTITVTEPRGPFSGNPIAIPGILQAEDYDKGGQGIAYMDNSNGNSGNVYRTDNADIDVGGTGHVIGWTSTGEWLEYTVNVASTGMYDFIFHGSSNNGGGMIDIMIDGNMLISDVEIPQTNDWDSYATINELAELDAGSHVLRIEVAAAGFNLDQIVIIEENVTGTNALINEQLIVFPNPSESGEFHMTTSGPWTVMTTMGQIVATGTGDVIDLSNYQKGIYLLEVNQTVNRLVRK